MVLKYIKRYSSLLTKEKQNYTNIPPYISDWKKSKLKKKYILAKALEKQACPCVLVGIQICYNPSGRY